MLKKTLKMRQQMISTKIKKWLKIDFRKPFFCEIVKIQGEI